MPWDERIMSMHVHDLEMLNIVLGGTENTTTSDDDIPTDSILAQYQLPKFDLPMFEKQNEQVKKLRQEGKLFGGSPIGRENVAASLGGASMTFDPLRGVGMPKGVKDGGTDV